MNDHRLEEVCFERFGSNRRQRTKILGIIKKSYQTCDAVKLSSLYKAMVRPHLEYANSIWGPFYKGDIKKAEAVQHRATKLIPELKDKPLGSFKSSTTTITHLSQEKGRYNSDVQNHE